MATEILKQYSRSSYVCPWAGFIMINNKDTDVKNFIFLLLLCELSLSDGAIRLKSI